MISIKQIGNTKKTEAFLRKASSGNLYSRIDQLARQGQYALSAATPMDSGVTANSWDYEIIQNGKNITVYWTNSNFNDGLSVAILIQYGHGTRNGGYVQGIDYINPALRPIFRQIADSIWKEATKT